jgi:hypothetical protein
VDQETNTEEQDEPIAPIYGAPIARSETSEAARTEPQDPTLASPDGEHWDGRETVVSSNTPDAVFIDGQQDTVLANPGGEHRDDQDTVQVHSEDANLLSGHVVRFDTAAESDDDPPVGPEGLVIYESADAALQGKSEEDLGDSFTDNEFLYDDVLAGTTYRRFKDDAVEKATLRLSETRKQLGRDPSSRSSPRRTRICAQPSWCM